MNTYILRRWALLVLLIVGLVVMAQGATLMGVVASATANTKEDGSFPVDAHEGQPVSQPSGDTVAAGGEHLLSATQGAPPQLLAGPNGAEQPLAPAVTGAGQSQQDPTPCTDQVINGGFESNTGWYGEPATNVGFSTVYAYSGARSAYANTNYGATASIWQLVEIPAAANALSVGFYSAAIFGDPGEVVYLSVYDESFDNLLYYTSLIYPSTGSWYWFAATLPIELAGQRVNLTFQLVPDGDVYYSEVNFDDVALVSCTQSEPATPTATATVVAPTATPTIVPPTVETPTTAPPTNTPITPEPPETPVSGLNLTVERIEVSQAIQTANNRVPLVAGRPAVARVFVGVQNASANVAGVTARLHAMRNGSELPDSPLDPFNPGGVIAAPLAPNRSQFNDSLNFHLPVSWLVDGPLTLWAEVNPGRTVTEGNYNDNRSGQLNLTVRAVPPLQVVLIPIAYQRNGSGPVFRPELNSANGFGLGVLSALFPLARIEYTIHSEYLFRGDLNTAQGWQQLLKEMGDLRLRERPHEPMLFNAGLMPKYYGVVPSEGRLYGGLAYAPGSTGLGLVDIPTVAAHEIGHNLGAMHTACGGPNDNNIDPAYPYSGGVIGNPGINPYTRALIADTHKDVMSYCEPVWISDYHYVRFMETLISRGAQAAAVGEAQAGWLITGRIAADGASATLDHAEPITSTAVVTPPGSGRFRIELRDQANEVQFSYAFEPARMDVHDTTLPPLDFGFVAPRIADLGSVQLWNESTLLATLAAAAGPPALSAPLASFAEGDPDQVTLTWEALNTDGSTPLSTIRYSADGGQTWQILATGLADTTYLLDKSRLPASTNGLVEIIASNTTQARTTQIAIGEVQNKPPQVGIVGPAERTVSPGEPLLLTGLAIDLEDGALPAVQLTWSHPQLGTLGQGDTLIWTPEATTGEHTIILTATDSAGAQSQASVTIVVTTPPTFTLLLPVVQR